MAVTQNLKGTSYPSFKIHKSGATLYQGSVAPSFTASHGDLYLQHGTEGALWLYSDNSWGQLGAGGSSTDTTLITNSTNTGSHVKQYVLFGETNDGTEHILAPTSAFSIDSITTSLDSGTTTIDTGTVSGVIPVPLNSANLFEVRVVARSASPNNNAGYSLKGVIVNDAGTTTLINDTQESILAESTSEWYAIVEANDNGDDSFVIKVSGSANTTVRWTAFVTLTSVATPQYTLSSNTNAVNEGDSVTFTLTTTHMSDGSSIAYTITGIDQADLAVGNLTGAFNISNNTGTLTFTLANDATTEGTENMTLALDNGLASADVVVVTDTSLDPTYTLSADNTTIDEGDTVTITLTTTEIADGTDFAYTVTGVDADDLSAGSLTGNITINSNTGTAVFTLAEDASTEGDETLTLTLDNGEGSIAITITDTSVNAPLNYVEDDYVVDGYIDDPVVLQSIDNATGSLGMTTSGSNNSQWFEFNGDGTALYVHNTGSGNLAPAGHLLNKYTLSTPYDLTTATYSNNVYYGSGNDYEGKFSGDGMRFYYNSGSGWMHNLASAYEPGTNIRASGQADGVGPGGESWCFSHDGMKLYTLAKSNIPNGVVYSEGTTAWDTTTFSLPGGALTGNTFNYGNEMTGASNIEMNSTGTKLYIYTRYSTISGAPRAIVEYDFGTAYDITTLTYNGKYLNVGSDGFQSAERISFRLENDNLIFVKGPNTNHPGNDVIYKYTIPTQGSGGGGSSTIDQATVEQNYTMSNLYANLGIGSYTFTWADNGNKFMVSLIYNTGYFYYQFDLTTPYDLTTASYSATAQQGWVGHGESVGFNNDGMKFYIERQGAILQYDLASAYSVGNYSGTGVDATLGTILGTGTAYKDWFWNSNGTKIYVADNTARTFKEYTLSSAWEFSTASHTATYDFSTDITSGNIKGMVSVSDLSKFYVLTNSNIIYEFDMSSAGDITTASLTSSLDITNDISSANHMKITHDDTALYIMGSGSELYKITL